MPDFIFENDAQLYLSDARGVYIPRDFVDSTKRECVTGVTDEDWEILKNPEHEQYWDTWCLFEDNAKITSPDTGIVYTLYQNGDLWLVPEGCDIPEHM